MITALPKTVIVAGLLSVVPLALASMHWYSPESSTPWLSKRRVASYRAMWTLKVKLTATPSFVQVTAGKGAEFRLQGMVRDVLERRVALGAFMVMVGSSEMEGTGKWEEMENDEGK